MDEFEIERNYYFDDLKSLMEDNEWHEMLNTNKSPSQLKAILYPQNPDELCFAESYMEFYKESNEVIDAAANGLLNHIDLDNSVLVDFYSDGLKTIDNQKPLEELEEVISSYLCEDEETYAKLVYEYYNFIFQDYDDVLKKVADLCEFDLTDPTHMAYFDHYMELLSDASRALEPTIIDDNESFIEMANHFHDLYVNELKTNKKLMLN